MAEMTKTNIKKILTAAAVLLISLAVALPVYAETLNEYIDEIVKYQTSPEERAKELEGIVHAMRNNEEELADQYDVPVSDIFDYETLLQNLINEYRSVSFIEESIKHDDTNNIDDKRVKELFSRKPPYDASFYVYLIEDIYDCKDKLKKAEEMLNQNRDKLLEIKEDREKNERAFRLYNEKIQATSQNRLSNIAEITKIRAKLEYCFVMETWLERIKKIYSKKVSDLESAITRLESLRENVIKDISDDQSDFALLDERIYEIQNKVDNNISELNKRYDALKVQSTKERTPFGRYWVSTEQYIIEDELLLTLSVVNSLSAIRGVWRSICDMHMLPYSLQQRRKLKVKLADMINVCKKDVDYVSSKILSLRNLEYKVKLTYGNENLTSEDERIKRDRLLKDIAGGITRYGNYSIILNRLIYRTNALLEDVNFELNSMDARQTLDETIHIGINKFLDFELWSVEDNPITVEKILLTLIIFACGVVVTLFISSIIQKSILRYRSEKSSHHYSLLVKKLLIGVGTVISFLIALRSLHIPLTAFAFMGGAFAIAIGLGAQKVFGDSISSLILFFQGKMCVGDYVVIGDNEGIVTDITLNSTVLLNQQSRNIIIPNSKVLESSILNLTLNDSVVRTEVEVAVAYDSDTELVTRLLTEVLEEDPNVLQTQPFRILFSEFQDSAIKFTVYFFIDLNVVSLTVNAQSSVRLRILEKFREHNIVIPYPQVEALLNYGDISDAAPAEDKKEQERLRSEIKKSRLFTEENENETKRIIEENRKVLEESMKMIEKLKKMLEDKGQTAAENDIIDSLDNSERNDTL